MFKQPIFYYNNLSFINNTIEIIFIQKTYIIQKITKTLLIK